MRRDPAGTLPLFTHRRSKMSAVQIMDEMALKRALTRLSFEIMEKTDAPENLVLVGIKTRGIPIAKTLADNIRRHHDIEVPVCHLDITFYRDDLSKISEMPSVGQHALGMDITGKEIVLVDDVLYTGRTIRAAIEAVFDQGRPGKIRLAVLIDRGHRELPIRPDYVGKNVPTAQKEVVKVNFQDVDGVTNVELYEKD